MVPQHIIKSCCIWLYKHFYFVALLICAVGLGVAYIAEFAFSLLPCRLCVYQRIPYYLLIFFTLLAMILHNKWPKLYSYYLITTNIVLLSSLVMVIFHFGVENKLFSYHSQCVSDMQNITSIADLRSKLKSADIVSCDSGLGSFLGMSMVSWHLLYATLAFVISMTALSVYTEIHWHSHTGRAKISKKQRQIIDSSE